MVTLKRIPCVALLASLSFGLQAKDFGTLGHTFPIIEPDLLEVIQSKLQTLSAKGTLVQHQKIIQQKTIDFIKKPKRVPGLTNTQQPRRFEYNPSIQVPSDLKDHQGHVFVKAGTQVNPLDYFSLSQKLLFIDGENNTQLQWALKQEAKIILVNGSPLTLSEQYQRSFYFDQSGLLTKKLRITQVPAHVFQKNKVLNIEELLLEEKS